MKEGQKDIFFITGENKAAVSQLSVHREPQEEGLRGPLHD
jgi:hypothetical protein